MIKTVQMDLEFMNQIPGPPKTAKDMYAQACSSDTATVTHWRDRWLANIQANHKAYGPFKDRSIGKLFGKFKYQPAIVAGSGPSLAGNIDELKDTKGIPIVSCLHNFHYMVDHEIPVAYFVTLDAGDITIEEMSEGGSKTHEEYLEATRGKTLLAFIGSPPKLLESWRGEILFYNCPIPGDSIMDEIRKIEHFNTFVSTGGNVLGASTYIAKAILGCNPITFVGADFSFSYTKQFHPWKSKYDGNIGEAMRTVDVYGNKVLTWQSYFNFKTWFDWLAGAVPGIYINCTEGGTLGAYIEGNIAQIHQMTLKSFLWMYSMHEQIRAQCEDPCLEERKLLF